MKNLYVKHFENILKFFKLATWQKVAVLRGAWMGHGPPRFLADPCLDPQFCT